MFAASFFFGENSGPTGREVYAERLEGAEVSLVGPQRVKFKPEYGSSDFLSGFFVRKKFGPTGREVHAERP